MVESPPGSHSDRSVRPTSVHKSTAINWAESRFRESRFVRWLQQRELCCDPTSTTNAGGCPSFAIRRPHDPDSVAVIEFAQHFGKLLDQLGPELIEHPLVQSGAVDADPIRSGVSPERLRRTTGANSCLRFTLYWAPIGLCRPERTNSCDPCWRANGTRGPHAAVSLLKKRGFTGELLG